MLAKLSLLCVSSRRGESVLWVARLLHTGRARLLSVAGGLVGWLALATGLERALRMALADGVVWLVRILAWAAAPLLAAGLLAGVMVWLGRHRSQAGSPARWVCVMAIVACGLLVALLLERLTAAVESVAGDALTTGVDVGLWFASIVLDP